MPACPGAPGRFADDSDFRGIAEHEVSGAGIAKVLAEFPDAAFPTILPEWVECITQTTYATMSANGSGTRYAELHFWVGPDRNLRYTAHEARSAAHASEWFTAGGIGDWGEVPGHPGVYLTEEHEDEILYRSLRWGNGNRHFYSLTGTFTLEQGLAVVSSAQLGSALAS